MSLWASVEGSTSCKPATGIDYKPSTYLPSSYLFSTYLPVYISDLFPTELVTMLKPNINSVEVHPQLSNNRHPVDECTGGCWFTVADIWEILHNFS